MRCVNTIAVVWSDSGPQKCPPGYRVALGVSVLQPAEKADDYPHMALRDIVERVSHEMSDLAGAVHRIQSLVSLLVREDAFHDHKNVHEMQSLDLIAQKIECLSDFLTGISEDIPPFWRVDAREAAHLIVLADLAARLTFTDRPGDPLPAAPGDFEAF